MELEIQDSKEVWVAWTNTDCTEGRGHEIPLVVCGMEATAIRLGKKGYIQGSDCPVKKATAVKINNTWLVPGKIINPVYADIKKQKHLDLKAELIEKALAGGFTKEELRVLQG